MGARKGLGDTPPGVLRQIVRRIAITGYFSIVCCGVLGRASYRREDEHLMTRHESRVPGEPAHPKEHRSDNRQWSRHEGHQDTHSHL